MQTTSTDASTDDSLYGYLADLDAILNNPEREEFK